MLNISSKTKLRNLLGLSIFSSELVNELLCPYEIIHFEEAVITKTVFNQFA